MHYGSLIYSPYFRKILIRGFLIFYDIMIILYFAAKCFQFYLLLRIISNGTNEFAAAEVGNFLKEG